MTKVDMLINKFMNKFSTYFVVSDYINNDLLDGLARFMKVSWLSKHIDF